MRVHVITWLVDLHVLLVLLLRGHRRRWRAGAAVLRVTLKLYNNKDNIQLY